jgi:hypothetical protein
MAAARRTYFCALLRLATTASSALRSIALNRMFVRSCIPQTRTREFGRESLSESNCQICSTSDPPWPFPCARVQRARKGVSILGVARECTADRRSTPEPRVPEVLAS